MLVTLLIVVGLINVAPLAGILSAQRQESVYGIEVGDRNLAVLLRHRAALFGLIGGFVLLSVVESTWRAPALGMALLSMASFLVVVALEGQPNRRLRVIAAVDLVGILAAIAALPML